MNRCSVLALLMLTAGAYAGAPDISRINGTLRVDDGRSCGDASTVNGAILVGEHASIRSAHTVNGRIVLGANSVAESLGTVNGSISVGTGSHVNGGASTTNGAISIGSETHVSGALKAHNGSIVLGSSADISGQVSTINGGIRLFAAHVGEGIETVSGAIELGSHSKIEGGIWVRSSEGWAARSCQAGLIGKMIRYLALGSCEPQLVVIGPDVVVQGTLRFDHPVRLYVNKSAQIGPVEGAQAIPFSGERPPV